ncbi:hypothetical protein, partial [Corynebacterium glyciniphilum]|uniref:hypothetical protein n=1 Tax=Corynebacterium glyciniphilum TaxID=1404244 RepID=UPI0016434313
VARETEEGDGEVVVKRDVEWLVIKEELMGVMREVEGVGVVVAEVGEEVGDVEVWGEVVRWLE